MPRIRQLLTSSNESFQSTIDFVFVFIKNSIRKQRNLQIDENLDTCICIYSIKCKSCIKTYIGETTNLRLAYNLHKQHIEENIAFLVTKYINECSGGKFSIMPINKMRSENERERKLKESYFIKQFMPKLCLRKKCLPNYYHYAQSIH